MVGGGGDRGGVAGGRVEDDNDVDVCLFGDGVDEGGLGGRGGDLLALGKRGGRA